MEDNFSIYTHNYTLNEKQKNKIKTTVDGLLNKVSSTSHVHIDLTYSQRFFEGKIEVKTPNRIFIAHTTADTIPILIKSLSRKIQKQTMKWKKLRTFKEIAEIYNFNDFTKKKKNYKKVA